MPSMSNSTTSPSDEENLREIQTEINRFESVHPNIYDLYEMVNDLQELGFGQLGARLQSAVESVENAFVASPEWTLPRGIEQIRLGVLGLAGHLSNKALLINRFLTGAPIRDDCSSAGRFKKLMVLDSGRPVMLLIRDEALGPDEEFSKWVDVVLFVFSVENEESFQAVGRFYQKIGKHRNVDELPSILAGTLDSVNAHNPRIVESRRAELLVHKFGGIRFYVEVHSMCGANVERVFYLACKTSLQHSNLVHFPQDPPRSNPANRFSILMGNAKSSSSKSDQIKNCSPHRIFSGFGKKFSVRRKRSDELSICQFPRNRSVSVDFSNKPHLTYFLPTNNNHNNLSSSSPPPSSLAASACFRAPILSLNGGFHDTSKEDDFKDCGRKTGRIAAPVFRLSLNISPESMAPNIVFRPSPGKRKSTIRKSQQPMGSGRLIPLKEGYLLKRKSKRLKKKYVTLNANGTLVYYPSLENYRADSRAKIIDLKQITVKVARKKKSGWKILGSNRVDAESTVITNSCAAQNLLEEDYSSTNSGTKKHKNLVFTIIAIDGKQWRFQAKSIEERDEWVCVIQNQILAILCANQSAKNQSDSEQKRVDMIRSFRQIAGNSNCADCGAPDPNWASINLGILICIQCSGLHRNLGTHISRVRSLELDDWPIELRKVMLALGNAFANSIWETNSTQKPSPTSSSHQKLEFIRSKYEEKQWVWSSGGSDINLVKSLVESVEMNDIHGFYSCLVRNSELITTDLLEAMLETSLRTNNIATLQLSIWAGARVSAKLAIDDNNGEGGRLCRKVLNQYLRNDGGCGGSNSFI